MFGEVTFAVLGVLFLIYDVRTFASTFQQTFYGQANTTLALLAGGVFATSLLAPIVGWRLGPRRSVGLGAAMLGIATLLATLSRNNISDLVLTVVGLAGGFWWLALFHAARPADRPSPFPVAVPIAIVLDLALRAAFRTIPVVDQPLTVAAPLVLVAALVFLAAGLISIGAQRGWTRPGLRGAVAIAALPALLLVAETGGTNGAQIALAGGLGYGTEGRSTELALVLVGLGLAAGTLLLTRPHARGVSAAIACGPGPALPWAHRPPIPPSGDRGSREHVPGHDLQHPSGLQRRPDPIARFASRRDLARVAGCARAPGGRPRMDDRRAARCPQRPLGAARTSIRLRPEHRRPLRQRAPLALSHDRREADPFRRPAVAQASAAWVDRRPDRRRARRNDAPRRYRRLEPDP